MSQFEGAGGLEIPHMYSIAQSMKKLQEDIHKISTGFGKLKIESYTYEDREREQKERVEYKNEQIAKSKVNNENA